MEVFLINNKRSYEMPFVNDTDHGDCCLNS
jgi:hypothetical protein